jgi:diketogulonate reductase-like aldo/keto reductase
MHWPSPFKSGDSMMPKDDNDKMIVGDSDFVDTYKAMEECQKKGKARAIGISNFSKAELERLLKETNVVPAAHQIELHPWLQQAGFDAFHKEKGIHITQYSPFGNQNEIYSSGKDHGKLMEDETLVEIGKKYNKSGAQVALAWGIAHGM